MPKKVSYSNFRTSDDIRNYWPKLKKGGYLSGHDYWHRHRNVGGDFEEKMVYEAVQEFARENDLVISTYGEHGGFPACWVIKKY